MAKNTQNTVKNGSVKGSKAVSDKGTATPKAETVKAESRVTLTQGTRAQWEALGVSLNSMGSWVGRDNVLLSSCKTIAENASEIRAFCDSTASDYVVFHVTQGAKGAHVGLCEVWANAYDYAYNAKGEPTKTVSIFRKFNGTLLLSDTVSDMEIYGEDELLNIARKQDMAEVRFDTRADAGAEWKAEEKVRCAFLGTFGERYQGIVTRDEKAGSGVRVRTALLKDAKAHENGRAVIVRHIPKDGAEGKELLQGILCGFRAKKAAVGMGNARKGKAGSKKATAKA